MNNVTFYVAFYVETIAVHIMHINLAHNAVTQKTKQKKKMRSQNDLCVCPIKVCVYGQSGDRIANEISLTDSLFAIYFYLI